MSLIPYQPQEGREVVLRHHNAIVVRDPQSHRLEIRAVTECPACHQPLTRPTSGDEPPYDRPFGVRRESYVDPDYFRMLRAVSADTTSSHGPPSPVRRILRPFLNDGDSNRSTTGPGSSPPPEVASGDAEFVSSTPGVAQSEGSRIRKNAFSPNYFNTFFVEERVLGRGGKGVVLLVRHEIDGCALGQFACKRVPVGDDHAWLEKVLVEVELLAKLSHPNLVSYRHVWLEDVRLTRFGPSVACAFILQQYCNGGDLHQYIIGGAPREATKEELKAQMRRKSKGQLETPVDLMSGHRQLSFDEIYSLFRDITSGVAYLHAASYIHRDLKPSNCLLHNEGNRTTCLISDFGEVQPEHVVRKSSGTTGTISYCAPEVLTPDPATGRYANFTTKSDIFSLGMILYFMCFGRLPYKSANALQEELEDVDELRFEIANWRGLQEERRERPDLPSKLYHLLKKLLSLNPAERPGANEVLKAMRGESTSFDLGRDDREPSPALGLNGSRVQNLDSPAPPSTPLSGPRHRRPHGSSDKLDRLGSLSNSNERDISPGTTTLDSRRGSSHSVLHHRPTHSMGFPHRQERRGSSVVPATSEADSEPSHLHDHEDSQSPPLLMAPPGTPSSQFIERLRLLYYKIMTLAAPNLPLLSYVTRLGLFIIKMMSLAQPCWPFMISPSIAIPLIGLAALDLGLPRLTAVGPSSDYFSRTPRAWGFSMSLVLVALHYISLWFAAGWDALCAAKPHDAWPEW